MITVMAKITIDIPNFKGFKQELEVSDRFAFRMSKLVQRELMPLIKKEEKKVAPKKEESPVPVTQ